MSKRNRKWPIVVLFFLCLAITAYFFINENIVFTSDGFYFSFIGDVGKEEAPPVKPPVTDPTPPKITIEGQEPDKSEEEDKAPDPVEKPLENINALWITNAQLSDDEFVNRLILEGTEQIVFSAKDYMGKVYIPFETAYTAAKDVVDVNGQKNLENLKKLSENGVECIAVLSVMRDNIMGRAYREGAITYGETTTLWLDRDMISWLNPENELVYNYTAEILESLKAAGVSRAVLEYASYPTIGKINLVAQQPKVDALTQLVARFGEIMPISVILSADNFEKSGQDVAQLEAVCASVGVWDVPGGAQAQKIDELGEKALYLVNSLGTVDFTGKNVIYKSK